MKIKLHLRDGDRNESKRQVTLSEAMLLIKGFLRSGATIIIESNGGKVKLVRNDNE